MFVELCFCDGSKRIITLLIHVYPQAVYTWEAVLWVVVQDKPTVHEQEDVADAIGMRHDLMQIALVYLNPIGK